MLDIQHLRLITTIAEAGNLARAARALGMGQPNLTRALAAIETNLRAPLFERDRRGVLPTDMCRAVLAEAEPILRRIDRLNGQLGAIRGGQDEELVIAAGPYVAECLGLAAMAWMVALHPAVRLRLATANWAEVPRIVREREAALGVVSIADLGEPPDLLVERLRPHPGIFLMRPGHPLAALPRPGMIDLMAWPIICPGRVPHLHQGPMATARAAAVASGRAHKAYPAVVVEQPHLALRLVAQSDAITIASHLVAAQAIASGQLVAVPLHEPWMRGEWGIIRLRGHRSSEAEDVFLHHLREADRAGEQAAPGFFAAIGVALSLPAG